MDDRATYSEAEAAVYRAHALEPRMRDIHVGEIGLHLVEIGASGGRPLLWVHGGGSNGLQFTSLIAAVEKLTPSRYRHVVVDRPGCGGSNSFAYWNVTDLRSHAIAVLRGVLDDSEIARVSIVANSMGALWSLWLALDDPKRVERLVLAGVPATFLGTSAPLPMRLASVPWIGRRLLGGTPSRAKAERSIRMLGHDPARIGEPELVAALAAQSRSGWGADFASLLHVVLRLGGARIVFDDNDWRRVEPPVHLVWGDRDPFGAVAVAHRAVELRPITKLDIAVGAGHMPWLEAQELCARAIAATP